jgi:hypothetical protein
MAEVRTYEVNLGRDPLMPTGVWDPAWNKPEVASHVAAELYKRLCAEGLTFPDVPLLASGKLPKLAKKNTETRTVEPLGEAGAPFKGGSVGEVFKRYAFGPRPASNFHAQQVCFGVDAEGRYFLQANVGLVGAGLGNKVALVVAFHGPQGELGGVAWEGQAEPSRDLPVRVLGRDQAAKVVLAQATKATVSFMAQCTG